MNTIYHASSVRSRVVVSEYLQALLCEFAHSHLSEQRHQVSRFSMWVLANQARVMRSSGVEVSQRNGSPPRVRIGDVLDDHLGHDFCSAVDRLGG